MYIDYSFYKDIYGGVKINEKDFTKFAYKAESIISMYTFDRVNDKTINKFPQEIVMKIKNCCCELAEANFDIDRIQNLSNLDDNGTSGIAKSKTAGAVSISYDNSSVNNFLDTSTNKKRFRYILDTYLYPQNIDGVYYNLMSGVNYVQPNDYII